VTDTARPGPVTRAPPAQHRSAAKVATDDDADDDAPRKAGKKAARPERDQKDAPRKKPAPADDGKRRFAKEDAERADADREGNGRGKPAPEPVVVAEPRPAAEQITIEGRAPAIERRAAAPAPVEELAGEATTEAITITGMSARRGPRLSAALGGGLAIDHGARGLLALDVRVETRGRFLLGVDAALWLVGGTEPQGRALFTFAAAALGGRLELGLGTGLHIGDGVGPAGALRLRIATPLAPLAGILRYDAALRFHRPDATAEHAITLGLELSY
jgi:hypothetical protein